MKLKNVLLAGLASIGLLTTGADSALAGGYFSAGNPGGLQAASGYHLAATPANQAWERNNAWTKYTAQIRQGANVSTVTSDSAHQNEAVTP